MPTIAHWKQDFLDRRGLDSPTSRPLYTYRVTTDEFSELEAMLHERVSAYLRFSTLGDAVRRADSFPALFVLYAAEWWRRRYDGTGFSWDPILKTIGVPADSWSQAQRSECVERGFREWKLRLSDAHGLRFLGSIAFQGGLPMQLLGMARGTIGRVLGRVLQLASSGTTDAREIQEWVRSLSTYLPNAYRQTEVFVLLAEVVVVVLRLKDAAQLTDADSAIDQLDQSVPNWRDSFPLPVEDDQAKGLIEQLIRDVAGRVVRQVQHIVVERKLEANDEDLWSLRSDIALPEYLDATALGSLFGIDPQDLTRTPTLRFIRNDKSTDVSLRKLAGQERFRVERRPLVCRDDVASAEHSMQLLTSTGQSHHKEISRGEALDAELPWIFEASSDTTSSYRLARQGSGSITGLTGLLCTPANWTVRAREGALLERKGTWPDGSRSVWAISGVVRAEGPEGLVYRVKCGQAAASTDQFELRGARIWDTFTHPDRAFRGVPKLYQVSENGFAQAVHGSLAWRVQGGRATQAPEQITGPVTANWALQGESRWRSRVVLLPTNASMAIEPGSDISSGRLRFSNWGLITVTCDTPDVVLQANHEGNTLVVSLSCQGNGNPPEWTVIRALWRGNPDEARIRVPFPAKGVRAIDANGEHLGKNALLAVGKVCGVRMIGFLGDGAHRAELRLKLHRGSSGHPVGEAVQTVKPNAGEGRIEIRLVDHAIEIQRMLAGADALDAYVSVRLSLGSGEHSTLRIARYSLGLERDTKSCEIRLSQESMRQLAPDVIEDLPVYAVRIDAPGEEPLRLAPAFSEGVASGTWEFPAAELLPGPWLIYPGKEAKLVFRPMLWSVSAVNGEVPDGPVLQAEGLPETDDAIGLAMALGISTERNREDALDAVIDRLATNFIDNDWGLVEQLAGLLGHLPMSTLDLWRRFTHSPSGMAALAFRMGGLATDFAERFPNELPFAWETIPLSAWVQSMHAAIDQGEVWYGSERSEIVISKHLDRRIQALASSCPSLRVLLDAARAVATSLINIELAVARQPILDHLFANQLFDGERSRVQQLLRNNADRTWPAAFTEEIASARQNGGAPYFCPVNYGFRDAVINAPVYLALSATGMFSLDLGHDSRVISSIRRVHSFDAEWFAEAFDLTIARCIATGTIQLN